MSSYLADFFRHNRWANLKLIDICAPLTDAQLDTTVPGTYGSIRATLTHLIAAEAQYAASLQERPQPNYDAWDETFPGFATLRETAERSGTELIEVAEQAPPDYVVHGVYDDGVPFIVPMRVFLIQAINHATEHRSQIMTILTQLGIEPPSLSGWAFDRATGQEP